MSTDKLPDGWTRVKFGDVVRNVNENSRDLTSDGLDRVVGLDHLDPGSLLLMRWDNLADLPDGTTFTRKFKPGQVLFGKRRAYQRKVAIPDFAGVCSGDILVFEPADKRMLAEFLPYLVQSDGFFDRALGTSAGSLSPRTKWVELAKYEFALPPLDEQQRIVELLGAASDLVTANRKALTTFDAAIAAIAHSAWAPLQGSTDTPEMVPLRDLAELKRGRFSHRPRNEPRLYDSGGPFPFVQTGDVQNAGRHLTRFSQFLSQEGTTYSRCVPAGTLLVTIAAVIGATAWTTAPTYLPDSIVSVEPKAGVSGGYLELLLRALRRKLANEVATENTQKNLSVESLGSVLVPRLDTTAQDALVARAEALWATMSAVENESEQTRVLATTLRESALSGRGSDNTFH